MNKASGAGATAQQAQLRQLVAAEPNMTIAVAGPGQIIECAQAAAATSDVLVAAGGDGTVSAVASVAIRAHKLFGVVPLGTLNHFAGDLGLPSDLEQAVQIIAAGHTAKIDYATVGDQVFLNNASIGVYPTLVRRREKQEKHLGKWPAAALEAWHIIRRPLARHALTIETSGRRHRLRTAFVFIGNNDYHLGDAGIGNRTSLTGGQLSLFAFRGHGRWSLLWNAVRTLMGRTGHPSILSLNASQLAISSRTAQLEIAHDGEVSRLITPLTFEIHPRALRVIVPKSAPE